jgi:hypothetical protein
MAMDIRQALLYQPENHKFHVSRQSAEILRDIKPDLQPASLHETLRVPAQSGVQPTFIEQWWMQQVRGGTDVAVKLLHHLLYRLGLACNLRGSAPGLLNELHQVHSQDRECLTGTIVEFASDATSFLILRPQQTP